MVTTSQPIGTYISHLSCVITIPLKWSQGIQSTTMIWYSSKQTHTQRDMAIRRTLYFSDWWTNITYFLTTSVIFRLFKDIYKTYECGCIFDKCIPAKSPNTWIWWFVTCCSYIVLIAVLSYCISLHAMFIKVVFSRHLQVSLRSMHGIVGPLFF